jgi:DnaK suppressor protein
MTAVEISPGTLLDLRVALWQERSRAVSQVADLDADMELATGGLGPVDFQLDEEGGDSSTLALDLDRTRALISTTRARVADIDEAIRRIDHGTYGTCDVCTSIIPTERLDALPTARSCVHCAIGGLRLRRSPVGR